MKMLLVLALILVVVGGGLKMAGVRLPMIDYPLGPMGVDGPGPGMRTSRSDHQDSTTSVRRNC